VESHEIGSRKETGEVVTTEAIGEVKWFSTFKGFGVVVSETESGEYVVRNEDIDVEGLRELKKGQRVRFELGTDEDGRPIAKAVRPI
jgi:CspA family cold shock protein